MCQKHKKERWEKEALETNRGIPFIQVDGDGYFDKFKQDAR